MDTSTPLSCSVKAPSTAPPEDSAMHALLARWKIVQRYIMPLAELLNAEISVIDANGICVSGTALYRSRLGSKVPEDNALSYSLRTGETTMLLNPGEDEVCKTCSKRGGCADVANFTGPVVVNGDIVAVVQFVAFTHSQRSGLQVKAEKAFDLIKHLISFAWTHELQATPIPVAALSDCFPQFIGESEPVQRLKRAILKVASIESTVLIQGESGTGKELIARAIHDNSPRKKKPFVAINCGALPEHLMESELYGYEPGAFSGADKNGHHGLMEQANGGTLFLDEISEMPLKLQVKLLRTLQERTIRRVGGTRDQAIDMRIVAATNKHLKQLVDEGLFREDLFFRLDVVPLHVPPLRERKSDIRLLISHFLQQFNAKKQRRYLISTNLYRYFESYAWPGNVRELKNFVEYGVSLCENDVLTLELMLPRFSRSHMSASVPLHTEQPLVAAPVAMPGAEATERAELQRLFAVHGHKKGAKQAVAKAMGISLATLYRKLRKWNMPY